MVPTKRRPNVIFLHKTLMVFSGYTLKCAFFVPPFVDISDSKVIITLDDDEKSIGSTNAEGKYFTIS